MLSTILSFPFGIPIVCYVDAVPLERNINQLVAADNVLAPKQMITSSATQLHWQFSREAQLESIRHLTSSS